MLTCVSGLLIHQVANLLSPKAVLMLKADLRKLDRFLSDPDHGDEVMHLSELDGFIAGILVCPDLIMPGEWLEVVWGEDGVIFTGERQVNKIVGLIMGHYNDVLRQLNMPGRYAPLLEKGRDGSIIWELWALGFGRAMALRPEAWTAFALAEDPAVRRAMVLFRKLDEIATRPGALSAIEDDALDAFAPELIPECLKSLHLARLALIAPAQPSKLPARSVGRSDSCPCGSGKKFKKCCLH